jgi:hypothetical protein
MEHRRVLTWAAVFLLALTSAAGATDSLTVISEPGPNPWTSLDVNNDPQSFQFAIVGDRTGGMRPGVFDDAVRKLNLLQPEFVLSVGDLIKGYSQNAALVNGMWDDFESVIANLKMPFFYVPGNHDLSNPLQHEIWRERHGRTYYHFQYRGVLFLCVNSEDPHRQLSAAQVDYFRKVLQDHPDARWTLVFMHQPLWRLRGSVPVSHAEPGENDAQTTPTNWDKIEPYLRGRNFTVFAGHVHSYMKEVRNDRNYYTLATSGGGSALRGAAFGEFDHAVWVTMTPDGPLIANLMLDGIWDDEVRTPDLMRLVTRANQGAVQARPIVVEPEDFDSTITEVLLTNESDMPMHVRAQFEPHHELIVEPRQIGTVLRAQSSEPYEVTVASRPGTEFASHVDPLRLKWSLDFKRNGDNAPVQLEGTREIPIEEVHLYDRRAEAPMIDGELDDWGELGIAGDRFSSVSNAKRWQGPRDLSFHLAAAYDDNNLYLALRVTDDKLLRSISRNDLLELFIAPAGVGAPSADGSPLVTLRGGRVQDPVSGADIATTRTREGYNCEIALPLSEAASLFGPGASLDSFRVNIRVEDFDTRKLKGLSILWWKPEWGTEGDYARSGLFVRR